MFRIIQTHINNRYTHCGRYTTEAGTFQFQPDELRCMTWTDHQKSLAFRIKRANTSIQKVLQCSKMNDMHRHSKPHKKKSLFLYLFGVCMCVCFGYYLQCFFLPLKILCLFVYSWNVSSVIISSSSLFLKWKQNKNQSCFNRIHFIHFHSPFFHRPFLSDLIRCNAPVWCPQKYTANVLLWLYRYNTTVITQNSTLYYRFYGSWCALVFYCWLQGP